jgi:pyridinium-3,5-bisthiocarboxylic acid mononucleotide nickel chelatase
MENKIMKNTLYLECYSGISGDMSVAALIDLGADVEVLLSGLKSLNVDGYKIEISKKEKSGIVACDFNVILDVPETDYMVDDSHMQEVSPNEDEKKHSHKPKHVRKYLSGHKSLHIHSQEEEFATHKHDHDHDHPHNLDHDHPHNLDHDHPHVHLHVEGNNPGQPHLHYGQHEHRNLKDINTIIDNSSITTNAKEIAKKIFFIIAVAESKAHGKTIEEVHFHEVGAVDSIVDITAAAICLDNLNIEEVIVSELYEGTGQINCQHGVLPVPVPAVVNIAAEHHLSLHLTSVKGELVTPTGAAIVAAIKTSDTLPRDFKINKIGLGAGKRNYERASFLRAMLIEDTTKDLSYKKSTESLPSAMNDDSALNTTPDTIWVLEANIDDCSGEVLSLAMEKLFENGAKDVYYTPIYMKKNRPAYLLGVICKAEDIEKMEETIFTYTTTIGIRKQEFLRTTLNREIRNISTPYGEAAVKICTYKDKTFYYPESDSIKKLSAVSGEDYTSLYSLIQTLAKEQKSK